MWVLSIVRIPTRSMHTTSTSNTYCTLLHSSDNESSNGGKYREGPDEVSHGEDAPKVLLNEEGDQVDGSSVKRQDFEVPAKLVHVQRVQEKFELAESGFVFF